MRIPALWPPTPKNHGQIWTITALVQLVDRLVFLCVWAYLCLGADVLITIYLLGHGTWLDFGIYLAIALLRPTLLIQASLSPKSFLSAAWFELCCHCLTIGIDIVFIVRLAIGIPSASDFHTELIVPPFDQVSLALYYIGFTVLSIDILVSIALYLIVLTAVLHEIVFERNWAVWRWNVRALVGRNKGDLLLLSSTPTQPARSTVGNAKYFIIQCRKFLEQHTLFRRNAAVEPAWLAAVRGTTALAAIGAIFALGALNTLILPMQQFKGSLPRQAIPAPMPFETGFANTLSGIVWWKELELSTPYQEPYWSDPIGTYSNDIGSPNFLDWFSVNASAGSTQFLCSYNVYSQWQQGGARVDLGIWWSCQGLRDNIANLEPSSSVAPPQIQLSWSGPPSVTPTLRSYIASIPIWNDNSPWMQSFGEYLSWNISAGTSTNLNVGKNVIYVRQRTFLEMVGLQEKPLEIVGYPVISATSSSTVPSSQTTIQITPSFGGFYDNHVDAWEEYLEHTMLGGLASTGGLYASLDVVFVLLFGRSVVGLLFGSKPLSPFGAVALAGHKALKRNLLRLYPGLDPDNRDRSKRSESVCDFLCDFVLDVGPLQSTSSNQGITFNQTTDNQLQPTRRDRSATEPSNESPVEQDLKEGPTVVRSSLV